MLFDSHDFGTDCIQSAIDVFVSSVNLFYIADGAGSIGTHGSD